MGWGRARGKPAYGTAVRIFMSPDGVREGYRREASLRHCGRNFYVSGWGGGGLEGKAAYGTAVGFFFYISREEKRMQAQEKNIDSGKTSNQHSSLAHHELNSDLGQISSEVVWRRCNLLREIYIYIYIYTHIHTNIYMPPKMRFQPIQTSHLC